VWQVCSIRRIASSENFGYHAATTNAIAAKGKLSPATQYQFFPILPTSKLSNVSRRSREPCLIQQFRSSWMKQIDCT
jgi:hypothetical protein